MKASRGKHNPVTSKKEYDEFAQRRKLSTSPAVHKKTGGKLASKQNTSRAEQYVENSTSQEPGDFSALENEIRTIRDGLREELKKIKAGGLDIEALENLTVTLKHGSGGGGSKSGKGSKPKGTGGEETKLGDIAQVVPRGRVVVIMVGEKDVSLPTWSSDPCDHAERPVF